MSDNYIFRITSEQFHLYDSIPSIFRVESIYNVEQSGYGLCLVEEAINVPFTRDYNADGQDTPSAWAKEFDLSKWGA